MRSRYCKVCGDFHDIEQDWPAECRGHFRVNAASSGHIIKDIDPYETVAADRDGKRAVIRSRREHREFLKRNDLVEVGNDLPKSIERRELRGDFASGHDIKAAIEQLRSQGRI